MKPLLMIAAGGTIDAFEYNFETGSVISFAKPAAGEIMEKVRPGGLAGLINMITPFQKDSDVMTEADRQQLLELCRNSSSNLIVITHGTGTIIDTARLLAQHLKTKTIVLTGSLPYTHDPAYAAFNLGSAITACQIQPPGVYLAMSGEIVLIEGREIQKVKAGEVTYFVGA